VVRLLGSCVPLVLSFLIAVLFMAPGRPAAPVAAGVSATASAAASAAVSAVQSVFVASPAEVDADPPVAPVVVVVSEPRTLLDTGVRAPAASRGPPHHFA
jgi:hypothetical protein